MLTFYTAPWCEACKTLKDLAYNANCEIMDIDTDVGKKSAQARNVLGVPALYDHRSGALYNSGGLIRNRLNAEIKRRTGK